MTRTTVPAQEIQLADLVEHLTQFEGPPEQFLLQLLAVQCRLASAAGGAVLRAGQAGKMEVLAVYPPIERGGTAPVWLAQAVESSPKVVAGAAAVMTPMRRGDELYGLAPNQWLLLLPLRGGAGTRGVAAFLLTNADPAVLDQRRERLELSLSLLSLYEMRLTLQRRNADMQRLRHAFEVLTSANEHDRFPAAAMAVCNQIASRWQSDRVTLGFLAGRYVKLRAMSHTEKFIRKTKLVQDLESAMEECLDQDVEVVHPCSPEATFVARSAQELATHHGLGTVCSLPLRHDGKPVAVLTVERPADKSFGLEEVETLRLAADLATARLLDLHEHDRWFGARAAAGCRKALAKLIGPEYTWAKVAAVAVLAAVLALTFIKGPDRVEAPFVVEAIEKRYVPAPFASYLLQCHVEPNQDVTAGVTRLAELDTSDLRLELASLKAELVGHQTQARQNLTSGKTAEAAASQAQADKVAAQIALLEAHIAQGTIVAPITGRIISGDLKPNLGKKIETGDVLFEIASIQSLRAALQVSEDRIGDLVAKTQEGRKLTGELATQARPGRYLAFEVERIDPVAQVVSQQNVFLVRVRLQGSPAELLRPGMTGVAKVDVGRRSYASLWTRSLVNWVRMKLWI